MGLCLSWVEEGGENGVQWGYVLDDGSTLLTWEYTAAWYKTGILKAVHEVFCGIV